MISAQDGNDVTSLIDDSEFSESGPALSPNGRWIAYQSDKSGRFEVYVRPYPEVGASEEQFSAGGGTDPVWSVNGRELFYRNSENRLVSVTVDLDPTLRVVQSQDLFDTSGYAFARFGRPFDISPDGTQFLMRKVTPSDSGGADHFNGLVLIQHWFEELKRLVPVD